MADQREQIDDQLEGFRSALDAFGNGLWSALPAVIESFNPLDGTCTARPTIKTRWRTHDGVIQWLTLPLLIYVPVFFMGGGGISTTFPVTEGDEALIVFADRAIDNWWVAGPGSVQDRAQIPNEIRAHSLDDGFAFVGFRSRPRTLPNINMAAAELRLDDGSASISLGLDGAVIIKSLTGVTVHGDLAVQGAISSTVGISTQGVSLKTHVHAAGNPDTGPAIPPPV